MKDTDVAELVRKQLNGNQSPSAEMGLTLEDIRLTVVNARAKQIEEDYRFSKRLYGITIMNPWERNFDSVPVLEDSLGKKYSLFPTNVFALPENKGVRLVYPKGEPENPFFPREISTSFALVGTPMPEDDLLISVAGDRVFYDYIPDEVTEVSMVLIPEGDSDIPDAKVYDVRLLAVKMYAPPAAQKDIVADSNDNVQNKQEDKQ